NSDASSRNTMSDEVRDRTETWYFSKQQQVQKLLQLSEKKSNPDATSRNTMSANLYIYNHVNLSPFFFVRLTIFHL
ncbi:MAG: hypothetical protein WD139_04775, partial [Balneolaceae bacterium]